MADMAPAKNSSMVPLLLKSTRAAWMIQIKRTGEEIISTKSDLIVLFIDYHF